jgi:PAS domain S-box-containing protein
MDTSVDETSGGLTGCFNGVGTDLARPPAFIEMLPIAIYACDADGRVLWFNQRAADLWGRSPTLGDDTELFCGSHKLFFDGRQVARGETPMAWALKTGNPVRGKEGLFERPDGSRVWATVHIEPVKDGFGRVVGAINCFHDSSERHHTEEDLRRRDRDLDDFFENGAVALHLVAADGTILRANKAELDLLGYTAEEYIGRKITDVHADGDVIGDILTRLTCGEHLDRYPARLRAKDGSIKHVEITSNVQFRDGQFVNTRCFTVDVTRTYLAHQQLQERERQFRELLDSLPAAVYTTDAQGRITYYNQAAVDFSGRRPDLGMDKWCVTWRLYWPDGRPLPHDQCPMAVALKEGRPVRGVEALAERPDGTRVPFIPFPTPFFDGAGNVAGAVNMLVDVSRRRESETQHRVLLDELNHRVKNNMQMLNSLLWTAQREARSEEAKSVLADASQRVAAMASAYQALYSSPEIKSAQAKGLVHAVCGGIQQLLPRGIRIADEAEGLISNNAVMPLALILNELLTNAVKHGLKGRDEGEIKVRLTKEAPGFVLSVEDGGPGFDLGEARRRSSGIGLITGLARQLGGAFEIERDPVARCVVRFPA